MIFFFFFYKRQHACAEIHPRLLQLSLSGRISEVTVWTVASYNTLHQHSWWVLGLITCWQVSGPPTMLQTWRQMESGCPLLGKPENYIYAANKSVGVLWWYKNIYFK